MGKLRLIELQGLAQVQTIHCRAEVQTWGRRSAEPMIFPLPDTGSRNSPPSDRWLGLGTVVPEEASGPALGGELPLHIPP